MTDSAQAGGGLRMFAVLGVLYLLALAVITTAFGLHYGPLYQGFAVPLPDSTRLALSVYPFTWLLLVGLWPLFSLVRARPERRATLGRSFIQSLTIIVLATAWSGVICYTLWVLKYKLSLIAS